jgi:8-oxo-dGTP diphosphatase
MIIVTAAVIINNKKVLIAQRKPGSYMEYKWEFPGGKLEAGETPQECVIREIKEELDMQIQPIDIYETVDFRHNERDMKLIVYLSSLVEGIGVPIECNDFRWITKDELGLYEFTPADIPVVEKLRIDKLIN